jgi:hypothetical protein
MRAMARKELKVNLESMVTLDIRWAVLSGFAKRVEDIIELVIADEE